MSTSPSVEQRSAVSRGRRIVPAPRYQTAPHRLPERAVPRAGCRLPVAAYRFLSRAD